jgi:hypothetical protein
MSNDQIISKLKKLEILFEEGRKECYSLRIDLSAGFYPPAPSGASLDDPTKKIIEALNKRKATFYKKKKQ